MRCVIVLLILLAVLNSCSLYHVQVTASENTQWKLALSWEAQRMHTYQEHGFPVDGAFTTPTERKAVVCGRGDTTLTFSTMSWMIRATKLTGKSTGPLILEVMENSRRIVLTDSLETRVFTRRG